MKVATLANRTSLFCAVGSHSPAPGARWNSGYYFTKCARCDRDLVRTAYSRWHEPKGFRVVWQAQAPASFVAAELIDEDALSRPPTEGELPIQEVIRHVQNGDLAGEAPAAVAATDETDPADPAFDTLDTCEAPLAETDPAAAKDTADEPVVPVTRAVPTRAIPDFMDAGAEIDPWDESPRRHLTQPVRDNGGKDREPEAERNFEFVRAFGTRFSSAVEAAAGRGRRWGPNLSVLKQRVQWRTGWPLVAAAALAAALLLVLWISQVRNRPAAPNMSATQIRPLAASGGQLAFVTAHVLNCRSAPAQQANSVKVLRRGERIRLIARDGDWVSLVDGGQCWALARYFSLEPPI